MIYKFGSRLNPRFKHTRSLVIYLKHFNNFHYRYETCAWGWNRDRKVEEMTDEGAWYLVAREKKGTLLAFSHFRFDMDFGDPVLYWCVCFCSQIFLFLYSSSLSMHWKRWRVMTMLSLTKSLFHEFCSYCFTHVQYFQSKLHLLILPSSHLHLYKILSKSVQL